jgi:hypothetical protein
MSVRSCSTVTCNSTLFWIPTDLRLHSSVILIVQFLRLTLMFVLPMINLPGDLKKHLRSCYTALGSSVGLASSQSSIDMQIDTPVESSAPTPASALTHEAALRAAYLAGMAARRSAAAQHDATTPAATAARPSPSPQDDMQTGDVELARPPNWNSMTKNQKMNWRQMKARKKRNQQS